MEAPVQPAENLPHENTGVLEHMGFLSRLAYYDGLWRRWRC